MRAQLGIALAALLTVSAASGCVSRPNDRELERDLRFVGVWMVEQPYHAAYEGSVYDFLSDGSLRISETFTVDDLGEDYVTGAVTDPQSGIRCVFAHRWYSTDASTLVIDGNCTDGKYREIALGFADEHSGTDSDVVVVSVGGEDGWSHDDWRWRWRRCDSLASCLP